MACNASKAPLLRAIGTRGYAATAQASHAASRKQTGLQTTTTPNKIVVASAESNLPLSRVAIVFRAGSRNETHESAGAAHLLRIAAGLSTKNATTFAITRHVQQLGGSLSCTTDRELASYVIEVSRDHLDEGLTWLQKAATNQVFKPWEISDNLYRVREDLKRTTDCVRAVDLLHQAAYQGGLGNSIFCPKHQIGKLSSETLQHFFAANCTAERCAVVGVGVDHQILVGYAQSLGLGSGAGSDSPSKYQGQAEIRWDKGGHNAYIAVATEGGSWKNQQEALAFAVLQHAAGVGPVTKRGGNNGALTKQLSASGDLAAKTINALYTDSGLFGFIVGGDAKAAGRAVEAGIKALKSGNISDDDVARGKAALKGAIARALDNEGELVQALGDQAALTGTAQDAQAVLAAVDGVLASDVKGAARKVASGKLSVGAVGNLAWVPRVSSLN